MGDRESTGPAVVFWLWMTVLAGGLSVMFLIMIGGV